MTSEVKGEKKYEMAAVFHYARLIPLALRVTLAGGATYGTIKAGAWSDGKESKERLEQFQQSLPMREVEYPPLPDTAGEQVCLRVCI